MTTEHHPHALDPMEMEVQIQYRKRRFFSARGRSLSDRGMYLEVRNLTLPIGTTVVLEMRETGREWFFIPAVVIHQDRSGIAVRFRDPPPVTIGSSARLVTPPKRPLALGAGIERGFGA
ncbi:PilZ domain-containing protein [Thiocystis violacea]|uniref:PilZ domain-containing protein n=1 Tax=Thiocystis violacea TaxID=13725 RepID=UPI001906A81F|nr:PilZ domain-containing protein [Thiocystis violacea]MBK1717283.1 hypothetical protein [Thiocystis violacea]